MRRAIPRAAHFRAPFRAPFRRASPTPHRAPPPRHRYRSDWGEAAFAFLDRQRVWRDTEMCCAALLDAPPAERALWETYVQAGPIGFDAHGHVVYLDRTGMIPAKEMLGHFDEDAFLRHMTFSREALRAYTTANCAERRKRLYKAVAVLDLKGFKLDHLKLMDLLKKANGARARAQFGGAILLRNSLR